MTAGRSGFLGHATVKSLGVAGAGAKRNESPVGVASDVDFGRGQTKRSMHPTAKAPQAVGDEVIQQGAIAGPMEDRLSVVAAQRDVIYPAGHVQPWGARQRAPLRP